jgi:hypothetical protein
MLKQHDPRYPLVIAVDFDNTIAKTDYPRIISEIPGAIASLIAMQKAGYIVILNTCRIDRYLADAVEWLANRGFTADYVNENEPKRIKRFGGDCRKISADYYIDDKNHAIKPINWKSISREVL